MQECDEMAMMTISLRFMGDRGDDPLLSGPTARHASSAWAHDATGSGGGPDPAPGGGRG
ncbi:hypothetical protein GCM10023191_018360 [Actinoallomurus oryzae]|uniref:Uncharacterized protein n=1 Tax=Actinoallomurus oryzae TaxID=502180 RepID=A0ABP8PM95_9ACTN